MLETGHVVAEYQAPTIEDMHLPDLFHIGSFGFGKQMLLMLLAVAVVAVFFMAAGRRRSMVPGKMQFAGEMGYGFVRNSLAKDIIGVHHFKPFVPLLFASFFFILVNNLWGSIPFLQLPTFSHAGSAYFMAGFAYLCWIAAGIKNKGLGGFLKAMTMPSGVPPAFYVILIPIEFLSNLIIRPITHSLRLFATMFAGHMAIMVAASLTAFLIQEVGGFGIVASLFSGVFGIFLFFLELLIQAIQAYVFTLLFAVYLQGAVAEAH
ncbi:F0F1 ATP synthase subunit A [Kocuria koreensis]|uniref:ATP synthase subunit a n=2 Tax=Rothia koreensis TaxID=592378 RepID=A0A7K1LFV3_9MICC|nr:F0F1 ATP synthase subunit A [Rothia koreensis]